MSGRATSPPQLLSAVVRRHAERLAAAGVPSPEFDAFALAAYATGLRPEVVRSAAVDDVPLPALDRLDWLVERRAGREPLQLITGGAGFRTITVICRPGVFVPRPETEILAGLAVDRAGAVERPVVLEPCTGTGVVACAVAAEVPGARVTATDRNRDAVELARVNAERLGLDIDVRHGDLLDPVPRDLRGHVDVLVSNPPYLTPAEVAASDPEVAAYDPIDALVGGSDGNAVIEQLLREGCDWVAPGGWVLLEIADARGPETAARAVAAGWRDVEIVADLAGRDRVVVGRRP